MQAPPSGFGTHPETPDGRYFVVRGRLWRCSNPNLSPELRGELVSRLMSARRAMGPGTCFERRAAAALEVETAKRALGERGPVWWTDGTPDYNRKLARNTPYANWFDTLG